MVLPIEFQPTSQADRKSDRSTGRNLNSGGHAENLLYGNAEVNARAVRWSRPAQGDVSHLEFPNNDGEVRQVAAQAVEFVGHDLVHADGVSP